VPARRSTSAPDRPVAPPLQLGSLPPPRIITRAGPGTDHGGARPGS
jgi:hypothetical protein